MKKILIAAGGTGGHVIPALTVAKYLQAKSIEVHWLGTTQGLEHQMIPAAGIPIHYISARGVRKKGWVDLLAAPWRMLKATLQAIQVIRKEKISLVAGFGGFVSAPAGFAAWLLRKPLLIQEQNAAAGLSNRLLSHFAGKICTGFPNTFLNNSRVIVSGNPVRENIALLPSPDKRFENRNAALRILILGGSQGASYFNELIPKTIAKLPENVRPEIVHSAGKRFAVETQQLYTKLGLKNARVVAFIEDMAENYAWADLVICRAGALTVAELAVVGLGSILIPYPHAVDDHQTRNALWLGDARAAIVIPQKELTDEKLHQLLLTFNDRKILLEMAMAARGLGKSDATAIVGNECLQLFENHF